jgi:predicted small lipoprotein YifL
MIRLALIALLTLTACGADGPPTRPGTPAEAP